MAVDAYVHHHLPGRLRLRVPAAKGEEEDLSEISSAIARTPGVNRVEYNAITGSILIQYSPEHYENLRSLESGLSSLAEPIALNNSDPSHHRARPPHHWRGRSTAARRVDSFFKQVDRDIRMATDNEVDLKFILPFVVGVLGLVTLRNATTTPLWLTLLIFSFNSFLGLHAPTPAELQFGELE
jgi:Heavy metal associated domain 2